MLDCPASTAHLGSRTSLRPLRYWIPLFWLAAIVAGLGALEAYNARPGGVGQTPAVFADWAGPDSQGRPRLVMFLHPRCPCSRASLSEFAEIVARAGATASVEVVFVKPEGTGPDWSNTALRKQAAAIAGARLIDDDGTLAERLGAETSGYVVLYDARGKLLFSGGITRSRGHEGESAGRQMILALLKGEADAPVGARTPVYGCALFAPDDCRKANFAATPTGKLP